MGTGLKLAVETELVKSLPITTKNVAEYILFADSMTCPLLKEYAHEFFMDRASDLLLEGSKVMEELKSSPSAMTDLMRAMSKKRDNRFDSPEMFMPVSRLRKELEE